MQGKAENQSQLLSCVKRYEKLMKCFARYHMNDKRKYEIFIPVFVEEYKNENAKYIAWTGSYAKFVDFF